MICITKHSMIVIVTSDVKYLKDNWAISRYTRLQPNLSSPPPLCNNKVKAQTLSLCVHSIPFPQSFNLPSKIWSFPRQVGFIFLSSPFSCSLPYPQLRMVFLTPDWAHIIARFIDTRVEHVSFVRSRIRCATSVCLAQHTDVPLSVYFRFFPPAAVISCRHQFSQKFSRISCCHAPSDKAAGCRFLFFF